MDNLAIEIGLIHSSIIAKTKQKELKISIDFWGNFIDISAHWKEEGIQFRRTYTFEQCLKQDENILSRFIIGAVQFYKRKTSDD